MRLCVFFTAILYVYGFFVRLCTYFPYVYGLSFAQVVRILRTYMAFCARWAAFTYVYGFLCTLGSVLILRKSWLYDLEGSLICSNSRWSDIEGYFICWMSQWSDPEDSLIWWKSVLTLVMLGPSGGSDIQGSVKFFFQQYACYDWTIWRIRYSGFCWFLYPKICTRFTVRSYLIEFLFKDLLAIHRPILP